MSLLVGCPVILPPRDDVLASWTHRPHLCIVNGAGDSWADIAAEEYAQPGSLRFLGWQGNAGVAASWNKIMEYAREVAQVSHVALVSQGVVLQGGTAHLADLVDEYADWRGLLTDFAWHCIVLSVALWEQVGRFDEDFAPAYYEDCLVPNTPVLTADLRWVPIGDLRPGDQLVGVDERSPGGGRHRCFRRATVTRTSRRSLSCYEITMEDGRSVTASGAHRWLSTSPGASTNRRWRRTDALRAGQQIDTPFNVWGEDDSASAGWLAGIIDGEAHMQRDYICIAQCEGVVLDRIKQVLGDLGIPYTWRIRPPQKGGFMRRPIANVEIAQRNALLELLGRLRPVRFIDRAPESWEGRAVRSPRRVASQWAQRLSVATVEAVGPRETISLETSTGTFVANGMISHNSDYVRRLFLAGLHTPENRMPKVERDMLDGSETTAAAMHLIPADTYGKSAQRFRDKWGGDPFNETYVRPYDPTSAGYGSNWISAETDHLGQPRT